MGLDPKVVSLFTGAGGIDYGFEAAGFRVHLVTDADRDCVETLRSNRPAWPMISGPIEGIASRTIRETARLAVGETDVLIGGPPCQPFSKSGYWVRGDTARLADPRANTLVEYMRCVGDLLPKVFLLENVHGISYSGKEEGLRLVMRLVDGINAKAGTEYRVSWAVLNTADYGVPQMRRRFFLVGHRGGSAFQFPAPTHTESAPMLPMVETGNRLAPYLTAWDAIGNLGGSREEGLAMRGAWANLLPSIPEGENYSWHTNRKGGLPLFGWRTRFWSFLLKLAKNRPSWTIQAQPGPAVGPFHWKNRRLSAAEMAALQTFPSEILILGSRMSVQRQLGNAVPSLMAEVLARCIGEQFFGMVYTGQPKLTVVRQRPIPDPEPTGAVPDEFRHLIGTHADHPGTGRGRGAVRRGEEAQMALLE